MADFSTFGWIHSSNVVLGQAAHCFVTHNAKLSLVKVFFFAFFFPLEPLSLLAFAASFILILDHFLP